MSKKKDSKWYFQQLLDPLFIKEPTPAEYLRSCVIVRESLQLEKDGKGSPEAAGALRAKLITHMGCIGIEGLAEAALKGDLDQIEGLILVEHLDYDLKKAHTAVRTLKQRPGESLKDYTKRAVDLWRGIRRVTLVDENPLDNEFRAQDDRAVPYWASGIIQPELVDFIRQGINDGSLAKGDHTMLMEKYESAKKWLVIRQKFARCEILHSNPAPSKSKQHQLVAAIAPPNHTGDNNAWERQKPTQRPTAERRTVELRQRGDGIGPCQHCTEGTFTRGKGCNNRNCKSKFAVCFFCEQQSFRSRRGCHTPGCQANQDRRQRSGNGQAKDL